MKKYKNDKQLKTITSVIILIISIFFYIKFNYYGLIVIFIWLFYLIKEWYNVLESVEFQEKDELVIFTIRKFYFLNFESFNFKQLKFNYKLGLGFRKSIMKLSIVTEGDNRYEISVSNGWSEKDIDAILYILRSSNAIEIL
jgi:hypothetical protein